MKRTGVIGLAAAGVLLLTISISMGAPWRAWRGSGGWGMGSSYQRMYNPATVENVSGTVESVNRVIPMKGMRTGIHLSVKTDKGSVNVHLGPTWYIERLDTKIQKGDRIAIKGSRVTIAGKPAIIAAEIKKGDSVLVLRDQAGIPVWAGWRRGK